MIGFVEGTLADRTTDRVVIATGGVGYELLVSATTLRALPAPGRKAKLFTHVQVRDDTFVLFGFVSREERDIFGLLRGVSGVGPKVALSILSVFEPGAFRKAVLSGDADAITIVPGVGKKVAARVVLDLKEKFGGEVEVPEAGGPLAEVRDALAGMGLSSQEVRDAMAGLEADGLPVEELLRRALQKVGSG